MGYLNRITLHWTGGVNTPSATDLKHYHYLIDKDGIVYNGYYKPEDNINCQDGVYAQHCGGGNTGNIGIAFCGCYVPSGVNVRDTIFPLSRVQLERGFKLCADVCKKYNIPVEQVQTHYEFGKSHPATSSHGKIDITYLHPFSYVKAEDCGSFIRNKILWYYNQ